MRQWLDGETALDGETMLDCETAVEVLEAYLDGDLAAPRAAAVEAHLEACDRCAAELELAAEVRSGLRALPELDAPEAVVNRVLRQTVLRETDGSHPFGHRRRRRPWGRPAWAALAAAAFAAVVVGLGFWPAPSPPPEDAAADAAEVARATEEARYALAYVAQVSRRTGLKLRQDLLPEHLVDPSARSLTRILAPREGASGEVDQVAAERERS